MRNLDGEVKVLVCVSDLHVGSTVAVAPDDFVDEHGAVVGLNPLQAELLRCWRLATGELLDSYLNGDPAHLVLNGDMVEGNHHRTKEIWAVDEGAHKIAAIQLLAPLRKKMRRAYMVVGTECHVGKSELSMGRELNCERNEDANSHAFNKLNMEINGCLVSFRHHISTTSREWLRASRLSIHLAQDQVAAVRARHRPPDMIVAGHCHLFDLYTTTNGMALTLPAWQALTTYGFKVVPGSVATPGIVILDWRHKQQGELPHVHPILFPPRQPTIYKA